MKIIYDYLSNELPEYLLSQEGIKKVEINKENSLDCAVIETSENITPSIVAKYIDLFEENKWPTMFAFDKQINGKTKKITYIVEDACCEYCHMNFIRNLFDNEDIVAVNSNFSFNKPAYNIEYEIHFKDNIDEDAIIKFVKQLWK